MSDSELNEATSNPDLNDPLSVATHSTRAKVLYDTAEVNAHWHASDHFDGNTELGLGIKGQVDHLKYE